MNAKTKAAYKPRRDIKGGLYTKAQGWYLRAFNMQFFYTSITTGNTIGRREVLVAKKSPTLLRISSFT